MNKIFQIRTVGSVILTASLLTGYTSSAFSQAENTYVKQYETQITDAQSTATTDMQKNYYPAPQPTTFNDSMMALNSIAGGINALVTYAYNTLTTLAFIQTPRVSQTMAGGAVQRLTISQADISAAAAKLTPYTSDATPNPPTLSGQTILNMLTTIDASNTQKVLTSTVPASVISMPPCSSSGAVTSGSQNCYDASGGQPATYTASFNMNSLTVPVAYTDAQKQTAQNFIQFAANLATPIEIVDMTKCVNDSKCMKKASVIKYLANLRTYSAQQSAGISALYQIFSRRTLMTIDANGQPVHLGEQAGLPSSTPNYPDASPLQVDAYLASRRVTDPNWYQAMETASDITLARENLYVAAENRLELFKLRMEIERLTALMAVLQIQQTRAAQTIAGETLKEQVETLKGQAPFNE